MAFDGKYTEPRSIPLDRLVTPVSTVVQTTEAINSLRSELLAEDDVVRGEVADIAAEIREDIAGAIDDLHPIYVHKDGDVEETITGAKTFESPITFSSFVYARGGLTSDSSFNVDGSMTVGDTLTVASSAVIGSALEVKNTLSARGKLVVGGVTELQDMSATSAEIDGNLTVGGNLSVLGETTILSSSEIRVTDSIITLNSDYVGGGINGGYAGIAIDRGAETPEYWIVFNEDTNRVEIGAADATRQTVATLEDITNNLSTTVTKSFISGIIGGLLGDVSGTLDTNISVNKLKGKSLPTTTPANENILSFSGDAWIYMDPKQSLKSRYLADSGGLLYTAEDLRSYVDSSISAMGAQNIIGSGVIAEGQGQFSGNDVGTTIDFTSQGIAANLNYTVLINAVNQAANIGAVTVTPLTPGTFKVLNTGSYTGNFRYTVISKGAVTVPGHVTSAQVDLGKTGTAADTVDGYHALKSHATSAGASTSLQKLWEDYTDAATTVNTFSGDVIRTNAASTDIELSVRKLNGASAELEQLATTAFNPLVFSGSTIRPGNNLLIKNIQFSTTDGINAVSSPLASLGFNGTYITADKAIAGNITGSSGSCTGNSATATRLAVARTIGGVAFDGSANIALASNGITKMTGYSKPATSSAITPSDTLNAAIGKLEAAAGGLIVNGYPTTQNRARDGYLKFNGITIAWGDFSVAYSGDWRIPKTLTMPTSFTQPPQIAIAYLSNYAHTSMDNFIHVYSRSTTSFDYIADLVEDVMWIAIGI